MKQIIFILALMFCININAQSTGKVNLYPNPTTGFVRVSFSEPVLTDVQITVSDILGNKIDSRSFKASESIYVDLSDLNLSNGMYLIKLEYNESIHLKRLVIKNN